MRRWLALFALALLPISAQAITYSVISTSTAGSGTGSVSVTPGTHATGDLLLFVGASQTTTETSDVDPSGYALITSGANANFEVWGKIATSSSEGAVSISFNGTSRTLAQIVVLRSDTGWPAIGSVLVGTPVASSSGSIAGLRYRSLTIATDNTLAIQVGYKPCSDCNTNAATAIATTGGYTAALAAFTNVANGLIIGAQVQGQTTATNLTQNDVAVTGNTTLATAHGISFTLLGNPTVTPVITDIDTDEIVTSTQINVVITGTDFKASQGDGFVHLICAAQTHNITGIDSWADTSIQIDMSKGNLLFGSCDIQVQNSDDNNDSQAITLNVPSGTAATTLSGGLLTFGFDDYGTPLRLYGYPNDLETTSQVAISNAQGCLASEVTVNADGSLTIDQDCTAFDYDFSRSSLYTGTAATWDVTGIPPSATVTIPSQVYAKDVAIVPYDLDDFFQAGDVALSSYAIKQLGAATLVDQANGVGDFSVTLTVDDFTGITPGVWLRVGTSAYARVKWVNPFNNEIGLYNPISWADNASVYTMAEGDCTISGLTLNAGTGVFSGTPDTEEANALCLFRVTDTAGLTADSP